MRGIWMVGGALAATLLMTGCRGGAPAPQARTDLEAGRLPTGARLDPAGAEVPVGSFPLTLLLSPDGAQALALASGWRDQGFQVVDRASGRVVQVVKQPASFIGLAFSPDGTLLYASGGNQDVIYRYDWAGGRATPRDSLMLAAVDTSALPNPSAPGETRAPGSRAGRRYPAGLALSPDGRTLYVAENLSDDLAVMDVARGLVVQRLPMERYPYGVVAASDGTVYASAWGGHTISVFRPAGGGRLQEAGRLHVGRHPSTLLLSRDGSRLYAALATTDRVAEIDTRAGRVLRELSDAAPAGPQEGTTPNGLALSEDGTRLFVAEADANAVAVFDLAAAAAAGPVQPSGRIPAGWYPTAVAAHGDTLLVLNGKGRGTGPNPQGPQPDRPQRPGSTGYTLGQIEGTLMTVPAAVGAGASELARWSARVTRANGWDHARAQPAYPPFRHVVYIIKENRTYDQVLGDLRQGDGDASLVYFPRAVSPNHHALAERFGLFDRFFVNAEVSPDGHNWSTAAYVSDYAEKTIPSNYSRRGRSYDYEGTNRDSIRYGDEDAASPSTGYLWDAAQRKGISYRNYGEFVEAERGQPGRYRGDKEALEGHTDPLFPGFNLDIPDQRRADEWLREFREFERTGEMPALEIMRLPNDHTSGMRAGSPSPRAFVADNDLALGRVIEALSRSRFWPSTVVFVLEDDAQNGPDHVDSHRSPLLVISAYNRGGVLNRFANTTDVLATISGILGLESLSQYDYYGRPLREIFAARPDLRPYTALVPGVSLEEKNPPRGIGARQSRRLDLSKEDVADEELFNRILWRSVKGEQPYPGARRAPVLDLRGR